MVRQTDHGWRFTLIAPTAQSVHLVGDFNQWSTTAVAMHRNADGVWEATIDLPPGTYHFRYFVDGHWMLDYAAFGLERWPGGRWDSVLEVSEAIHRRTERQRMT